MTTEERFWQKVDKGAGCWVWGGARDRDGYGNFNDKGKVYRAHRYAYMVHYGVDPGPWYVCHKCDNPACVNPDHLFLGDQKANRRDAMRKGRVPRGVQNGRAKLTPEIVLLMRKLHKEGTVTATVLAEQYGVDRTTVQQAINGTNWAWLK